MIIVLLLVIALALLVFGLVKASALLLIGSLIASALAAVFVFRNGRQARHASPAAHRAAAASSHVAAPAPASAPQADVDVWVIDGRPRYHRESCEIIAEHHGDRILRAQAVEDGFIACSLCEPDSATAS